MSNEKGNMKKLKGKAETEKQRQKNFKKFPTRPHLPGRGLVDAGNGAIIIS